MTLYEAIVRENAPIRKNYNDFYKEYHDLAGTEVPTEGAIKAFQMSRLRMFSIFARSDNLKTQAVNNFLQNSAGSLNDGIQNSIIHNKITELEEQLKREFFTGWANIKKNGLPENKALLQQTHNNLKELYILLQSISTSNNPIIPGTYMDKLSQYINSLGGISIHDVMKNYWNLQGEILEAEGAQWFNERLPQDLQVQAFNIGKLNIKGKGQAISDILLMDMSLVNLDESVIINYSIEGKSHSCSLRDFLIKLKDYNGTKQIVISEEDIGKILSKSVMGIQAKSGKNQLPWNIGSKNTWVSIDEFDEPEKYALNRVDNLRISWDEFDKNIKTQSSAYNALADYGLATVLNKVLHLDENENSYILTPFGFMTYEDRIEQLFEGKGGKYYFHLNNVKMDSNLHDSKQVVMPT